MLSIYSIITNSFYVGQLRGKCETLLAFSTAVKNVVIYILDCTSAVERLKLPKSILRYLCRA